MVSISNISESFCDWRSHIDEGDSIQAYDGRGWYAATIYNTCPKSQRLYISYDNYSSQYNFNCSRHSNRIRPTIGFLRKKIMVPQAEKIKSLQTNRSLEEENKRLRDELGAEKQKWDTKNYQYLMVKKLSSTDLRHVDDIIDLNSEDQDEIEHVLMQNVETLSKWNKITKELNALNDELNETKNLEIKDLVRIQVMMEKELRFNDKD